MALTTVTGAALVPPQYGTKVVPLRSQCASANTRMAAKKVNLRGLANRARMKTGGGRKR